MQTQNFRRGRARRGAASRALATPRFMAVSAIALSLIALATSCAPADNVYAKLPNPPLVEARLHTMTVLATADGLGEQLATRGYSPTRFPSNYPGSVRVEAALWQVPEGVAADARHFIASAGPSIRLLVGLLPDDPPPVDQALLRDFYRNVLGVDVPHWPANVPRPDNARVHAWTYFVPGILEARRKFREHGIPVDFAPVAITTAYLGDHKKMGIRAPDGAIIELVETAAQ
jgi:hypothetical protein